MKFNNNFKKQGAWSKEQRAESKEQRAKSKEQRFKEPITRNMELETINHHNHSLVPCTLYLVTPILILATSLTSCIHRKLYVPSSHKDPSTGHHFSDF